MAFSDDMSMGNDSVMDCIFTSNNNPTIEISYNLFTQNIPLIEASKNLIFEKSFLKNNGIFGCSFIVDYNKINTLTSKREKEMILKLNNKNWWHILFAQGPSYENGIKQFHILYQKSDQLIKICEDCTDEYTIIEQ
ncbi:BTB domain-containing protein [Meloidogyne graminicola]|uniref:BTB domain-containing protein n=1 Tax=Meloidogyne graminicola TaxID=189291 RepID=A0A8S9ZIH1_9BILA|nr:BTB domain-containing protein [Meloidogyne graminicola]